MSRWLENRKASYKLYWCGDHQQNERYGLKVVIDIIWELITGQLEKNRSLVVAMSGTKFKMLPNRHRVNRLAKYFSLML